MVENKSAVNGRERERAVFITNERINIHLNNGQTTGRINS